MQAPPPAPPARVVAPTILAAPARRALWLFIVTVLLNVLLRAMSWRYDWFWAFTQFGFVPVVYAPVVAGAAAFAGAQRSRSADLLGASGSTRRALWLDASATWWWSLVGCAPALMLVVVLTAWTTRSLPSLDALEALIPMTGMLMLAACSGTTVGWWLRHWSASILAAGLVFGGMLAAFIAQWPILVETGGASSDLEGLRIPNEYILRQGAWFVVASVLVIELALARPRWVTWGSFARPVGVTLLLIGAAVATKVDSPPPVEPKPFEMMCVGDPQMCVTPPYVRQVESLRPQVERVLEVWAEAGGERPTRFVQTAERNGFEVSLPGSDLRGEQPFSPQLVLNGWLGSVRPDCTAGVLRSRDLDRVNGALRSWLEVRVRGSALPDSEWALLPDEAWADLSDEASVAWARQALQDITAAAKAAECTANG